MKLASWQKLAISICVPLLAGVIGSVFTAPAITSWYASLNKPSFNPPNWVFAPVWTLLYVLMGIALFLVWNKKNKGKGMPVARKGIVIFAIQLFLNALWSLAFFGMHSPKAGLVVIALLWIAIIANIILFRKVSRTAALLLVPYILWVSFAAALNLAIMIIN